MIRDFVPTNVIFSAPPPPLTKLLRIRKKKSRSAVLVVLQSVVISLYSTALPLHRVMRRGRR